MITKKTTLQKTSIFHTYIRFFSMLEPTSPLPPPKQKAQCNKKNETFFQNKRRSLRIDTTLFQRQAL